MANWNRKDISITKVDLDKIPDLLELEGMMMNKIKNKSSISCGESLVLHLRNSNSKPFQGFDISKIQERSTKEGQCEILGYSKLFKPNMELLMLERKEKMSQEAGSGTGDKLGTFLPSSVSGTEQSYFADLSNPTAEEIDAYFLSITQNRGNEIRSVSKLLLQDYWPKNIFNLANFDSPMQMTIKPQFKDSKDLIGINRPELLIGVAGACSPSTRAQNSFGILNLLVQGGPAMWVTIHPDDNKKYVEWVTKNLGIDCDAVLDGRKHIIPPRELNNAGIRFFTALQEKGDLMVLFPGVFYLTWNLAFAVQSSVNFIPVHPKFNEPVRNHKECTCPIPPKICKDCNGVIRPPS